MTTPAGLLDIARPLAIEAGELIESMRDEVDLAGDTKSSSVDVVTAADQAAEALIVERLLALRPDDGLLGEEGAGRTGSSGVRWIIDPIDGTTNYVYAVPSYGVSIAAELDGTLVAGVVYEPVFNRCYSACVGGGAFKNGEPITANTNPSVETALVATGFGYIAERRRRQAEILVDLLPRVRDIRRFGSAALDLCYLAEGLVDAYYERGLHPWDLSAGAVIASEAGAVVGDLRGQAAGEHFTLAANPLLFESLRSILADLDADDCP